MYKLCPGLSGLTTWSHGQVWPLSGPPRRGVYHRPVARELARHSDTLANAAGVRRASPGCAAVTSIRVTLAAPSLEHRL